MNDENSIEITVHLRFRMKEPDRPPVTARDVLDWLKQSSDLSSLARRHGAQLDIMISDGHCSEVIDFDGTHREDPTVIMDRPSP